MEYSIAIPTCHKCCRFTTSALNKHMAPDNKIDLLCETYIKHDRSSLKMRKNYKCFSY